jgi:hypothetical protein
VPPCKELKPETAKITASVAYTVVPTDVIFVTDASGSMSAQLGAVNNAVISSLTRFNAEAEQNGAMINIGLIAYNSSIRSWPSDSQRVVDIGNDTNFTNAKSEVSSYVNSGGTYTKDALVKADSKFNGTTAQKKIVILLSDGNPSSGQDPFSTAKTMKQNNKEIYTIAYNTDAATAAVMCRWSSDYAGDTTSGNCTPSKYAFVSGDAQNVYANIIASILEKISSDISLTLNGIDTVFNFGAQTSKTIDLNLGGVTCNQTNPAQVPLQVNYNSNIPILLSNPEIEICTD